MVLDVRREEGGGRVRRGGWTILRIFESGIVRIYLIQLKVFLTNHQRLIISVLAQKPNNILPVAGIGLPRSGTYMHGHFSFNPSVVLISDTRSIKNNWLALRFH